MAELDSGITAPSALTGRTRNLPEAASFGEFILMGVGYQKRFGEYFDVSEGGINDSLFLDFNYIRGPGQIGAIRAELAIIDWDHPRGYSINLWNRSVPMCDGPCSIEFPLSQFPSSVPGPRRLDQVARISFGFYTFGQASLPPSNNYPWEFSVDRIRAGRTVPGPSLISPMVCGLLAVRRLTTMRRK